MSSFSAFLPTKTEAVSSHFAMLTLLWQGSSVCGEGSGGDLLCHPDLVPSVQFSPDKRSSSTREQHYSKICQVSQYPALKSRFHFNRPIPRFRDRGSHRALYIMKFYQICIKISKTQNKIARM